MIYVYLQRFVLKTEPMNLEKVLQINTFSKFILVRLTKNYCIADID